MRRCVFSDRSCGGEAVSRVGPAGIGVILILAGVSFITMARLAAPRPAPPETGD